MRDVIPSNSIRTLPLQLNNAVANELMQNDDWKIIVQWLENKFPGRWKGSINEEIHRLPEKTPAEILLFEMGIRLCTIGGLWRLLKECELLSALSIIHPPEPLVIILQPNVQAKKLRLKFRDIFSIRCKAFSLPPPEYQWYFGNLELESETSPEFQLSVIRSDQEGEYRCRIVKRTNEKQIVEDQWTQSVELAIIPTPVNIIKEPARFLEIPEGKTLILDCEAESHPRPDYQWYHNSRLVSEQTSNILTIPDFSRKNTGKYSCRVSNISGEKFTEPSIVYLEQPRETAMKKNALLIGNSKYKKKEWENLTAAKRDAKRIADKLCEMNFTVIFLYDLTRVEMLRAIQTYCNTLDEGYYGFFYYAGHGIYLNHEYMVPVDAPANCGTDDLVSCSDLFKQSQKTIPKLRVFIFDMCLDMPASEQNPKVYDESHVIKESGRDFGPKNFVAQYATSPYRLSWENKKERCGIYTKHLLRYIDSDIEPVDLSLRRVAESFEKEVKGDRRHQAPMYTSNLGIACRLNDKIVRKIRHFNVLQ